MTGSVLGGAGEVNNGELHRTSLCHHEAYSAVGEADDQENHVKKCKVVMGRAGRESVSDRGLTQSEWESSLLWDVKDLGKLARKSREGGGWGKKKKRFQVEKAHLKRRCGREEQGALTDRGEVSVAGAQPGVCTEAWLWWVPSGKVDAGLQIPVGQGPGLFLILHAVFILSIQNIWRKSIFIWKPESVFTPTGREKTVGLVSL